MHQSDDVVMAQMQDVVSFDANRLCSKGTLLDYLDLPPVVVIVFKLIEGDL
jgi:hypothetical protein